MPNSSSYNGIDMGNIASINGQDVPAGGSAGVSESSTGVLYFEGGGFNKRVPYADAFFGESSTSLYKAQLSTRTDIVSIKMNTYHMFALDSSGNLYSSGWTNSSQMGRNTSAPNEIHKLAQCLTSVSSFSPHGNGCWAVKTDGTLWWAGNISNYATSSDTGQGTTLSPSSGWYQFGSDTDWIKVDGWISFPAKSMAIKGGTGAEYAYVCGQNTYYATGLGTTSGYTKPWTRIKSGASTDWSEAVADLSVGMDSSLFVTKSGKLFSCGEANYGVQGQGNTTDQPYVNQIGTDTDWATPYAKARTTGYCIKTDGSLYGSTNSTFNWGITPTTADRTYRQIGSDTDYQELRTIDVTYLYGKEIMFAKKNNVWYVNWDNLITPGSFTGNTANQSAPASNTWKTINELLEGTDVSPSVREVALTFKDGNTNAGEVLILATAAS